MLTELEEVHICFAAYLERFFVDVAVTVAAVTDAAAVTVTATAAADVIIVADKNDLISIEIA